MEQDDQRLTGQDWKDIQAAADAQVFLSDECPEELEALVFKLLSAIAKDKQENPDDYLS